MQTLKLCTGQTAHRGSRGIALLFLDHGTRRGEGSASRFSRIECVILCNLKRSYKKDISALKNWLVCYRRGPGSIPDQCMLG